MKAQIILYTILSIIMSIFYISCRYPKDLNGSCIFAKRNVIYSGFLPGVSMNILKLEFLLPQGDSVQVLKVYNNDKIEIELTHYENGSNHLSTTFKYDKYYYGHFLLSVSTQQDTDMSKNYDKELNVDLIKNGKKMTKKVTVETKYFSGN